MKKILIVDDVKGWRDYHKQILNEFDCEFEVVTVNSAKEGYDKLMQYNETPFDIIFTDLQMENDFEPKYAGEWFIEQIKTFKSYVNTKIVVISATYNIRTIAESYGVFCIPKSTAIKFPQVYQEFLN